MLENLTESVTRRVESSKGGFGISGAETGMCKPNVPVECTDQDSDISDETDIFEYIVNLHKEFDDDSDISDVEISSPSGNASAMVGAASQGCTSSWTGPECTEVDLTAWKSPVRESKTAEGSSKETHKMLEYPVSLQDESTDGGSDISDAEISNASGNTSEIVGAASWSGASSWIGSECMEVAWQNHRAPVAKSSNNESNKVWRVGQGGSKAGCAETGKASWNYSQWLQTPVQENSTDRPSKAGAASFPAGHVGAKGSDRLQDRVLALMHQWKGPHLQGHSQDKHSKDGAASSPAGHVGAKDSERLQDRVLALHQWQGPHLQGHSPDRLSKDGAANSQAGHVWAKGSERLQDQVLAPHRWLEPHVHGDSPSNLFLGVGAGGSLLSAFRAQGQHVMQQVCPDSPQAKNVEQVQCNVSMQRPRRLQTLEARYAVLQAMQQEGSQL